MKIEHLAFNVEDPLAMGRWYVEHLGFQVRRRTVEPPYAHFLADDSGTVMLEIYGNREAPVPDYRNLDTPPCTCAVSENVQADADRLVKAGATLEAAPQTLPTGDTLAMLRDPWGLAIQLVKRGTPMIPEV